MNHSFSISVDKVNKTFMVLSSRVKIRVLKDITFDCKPGQLILLVGKNGSGKSTLLRIIARIIKPSSGQISTKGTIGYYPQNPSFNKGITTLDFINYLGSLKDRTFNKEKGILWLKTFGIEEKWFNVDTNLLSEGMRRRVALSLSFLGSPDILLLDEPLENLDKTIKAKFIELLEQMLDQGKTILIASHEITAFMKLNPVQINLEKEITS